MKPWDPPTLKLAISQGVDQYLLKIDRQRLENELSEKNKKLEQWNQKLEQIVAERTREVCLSQEATVLSLTALTETRDNETGNHILRTQHYVKTLSEALSHKTEYSSFLTEHTSEMLFRAAPLHDIGKVGVPDSILKKEGQLNSKEFKMMKQHTILGRHAITKAQQKLGELPFLTIASEIAYSHHEHWDGSGYPEGLCGEEIPLAARIMAIADVYDALVTKRCYKNAMSHEDAVSMISKSSGTHFDPIIVKIFLEIHNSFHKISRRFED
jgi:putative two-component system response regulator